MPPFRAPAESIGFTMALFVAELAFAQQSHLHGVAKLAVLVSSAIAIVLAIALGRSLLARAPLPPDAAKSPDPDAEDEDHPHSTPLPVNESAVDPSYQDHVV